MGKKIIYEEIKEYIEGINGNGCKLQTTKEEYINNNMKVTDKLDLVCKCGDAFKASFSDFTHLTKSKKQCNKCGRKNFAEKMKISYEKIKKYIEIESDSGCSLLTDKDNYTITICKIDIQCKCGNIFTTTFNNFKNHNRRKCDICSGMIKWDYDKVKHYIEVESKSNCQLLSNSYQNYNANLLIKCPCGNEFRTTFAHFYLDNKRQCNECSGITNWTYEKVKYFVEVESNSECELLSEQYNKYTDKLLFQCKCGNKFETSFANFKNSQKRQCNICSKRKSNDEFVDQIFNMYGNEYIVLSNYISNKDNILIKHNVCGNEYYTYPDNILQGKKCPICAGNKKKNTDKFKIDVFNKYKDEYIVLGEYINSKTPILMKHNIPECGHEWAPIPNNLLKGTECPICAMLNRMGENAPNWNFNLTDEERISGRFLNAPEYKKWRTNIFKKDNYTCQCCGDNKGGNLRAHHLDGYDWCEERRMDINNGITLCKECHDNFHYVYGYGGNTKEQFEEWLNDEVEMNYIILEYNNINIISNAI